MVLRRTRESARNHRREGKAHASLCTVPFVGVIEVVVGTQRKLANVL